MKRKRRDICDVFEEMRRLFDESRWGFPVEPRKYLPGPQYPVVPETYTDMVETEKEIIFTAELPGVKKENININVTENTIEVSTEAQEEEEKKESGEYSYYSRYSGFKSSYSTPVQVDSEKVKASYKNGVLEIRAPKKEVKKSKKIRVE